MRLVRSALSSKGLAKPKDGEAFSSEHLKYLCSYLDLNRNVCEANKASVIEAWRQIAEILVWGDRHDPSVFELFMERDLLKLFLLYMVQKDPAAKDVSVQLLQTISLIFSSVNERSSVYFLLSGSCVNEIISHRFDFSDEDIMAHYISLLKSLSNKLTAEPHLMNFFFNVEKNNFPLYIEALKFFQASDSMIRNAVRSVTLQVFENSHKLSKEPDNDQSCRQCDEYICEYTAEPYFANLIYFITTKVLDMHNFLGLPFTPSSKSSIQNFLEEQLLQLTYLNDVLRVSSPRLCNIVRNELLKRLILPLYVASLHQPKACDESNCFNISPDLAIFFLAQVFTFCRNDLLLNHLSDVLLTPGSSFDFLSLVREARIPPKRLKNWIEYLAANSTSKFYLNGDGVVSSTEDAQEACDDTIDGGEEDVKKEEGGDEKEVMNDSAVSVCPSALSNEASSTLQHECSDSCSLVDKVHLHSVFQLVTESGDYACSMSLTLLLSLELWRPGCVSTCQKYRAFLFPRLIAILESDCHQVRPISIALACRFLLVLFRSQPFSDTENAQILGASEQSCLRARAAFSSKESFLSSFESLSRLFTMHAGKSTSDVLFGLLESPDFVVRRCPEPDRPFVYRSSSLEPASRALWAFFALRWFLSQVQLNDTTESTSWNEPLRPTETKYRVGDVIDVSGLGMQSCILHGPSQQTPKRSFFFLEACDQSGQLVFADCFTQKLGTAQVQLVFGLVNLKVSSVAATTLTICVPRKGPDPALETGRALSNGASNDLFKGKIELEDPTRKMIAFTQIDLCMKKARQIRVNHIRGLLGIPENAVSPPGPSSVTHTTTPVSSSSS